MEEMIKNQKGQGNKGDGKKMSKELAQMASQKK